MKIYRCGLLLLSAAQWLHAQIPAPTDAPKPRTPEQGAAAFKLPEGFRMEIVASEPLIASPSGICWDEHGQMFVSELHGYNLEGQLDIDELNKTGQLDTVVRRVQADEKFKKAAEPGTFGIVKRLRDTNGDGRMDAADTWATNLPPAYGLVPARGGIIVACAPHIMFLADRNGDGKAEVQQILFTGFRTGALERGINAPQWGLDGWIYFGRGHGGGQITGPNLPKAVSLPGTDFRIQADGSAIEPLTGGTGTFGFALTDTGDRFTMSTSEPGRFVAPLPWHYLIRNPDAAMPALETATGDRRVYSLAPAHPWRQKRAEHPAYSKYYRDRYGAGDSDASGWFTSACSPLIYQDHALPGLRGHYLVCEPSGNLIHRAVMEPAGPGWQLRRAPGEEQSEFAATADSWSHPMNLCHGPDGSIWIVDYYREIIEDYSAIPRHLQQQYGLYAGHDRGRVYRLTHRDAPAAPTAGMSGLKVAELVRETGSPYFWRRQTAQRLLVESRDPSAHALLRGQLAVPNAEPAAVITALRALGQLDALTPADILPLFRHANSSVRVHALQLDDRWLRPAPVPSILDALLAAAAAEDHPRVLIQLALSLGESNDPRAFAALVRFARQRLSVRWMDLALLSSLHGRGLMMIEALIREPSTADGLIGRLAQSIAASRDGAALGRTLALLSQASSSRQTTILAGLANGRKNAARAPLADPDARARLAQLAASSDELVRQSSRALEATFVVDQAGDELLLPAGATKPSETVSEESYRKFVAALAAPRNLQRGREVFTQACATCHRIGGDGFPVGPDLLAQIGLNEESLLKEILMPSERIRPGFETTVVETIGKHAFAGILKEDGPTSLSLVLPGGVEHSLLRKEISGVRRLASSLMPSFAETLAPADAAHLLAWLQAARPPLNTK